LKPIFVENIYFYNFMVFIAIFNGSESWLVGSPIM